MGTDCYLAKKKKETADIEFVQLDRLYYFQDEFPSTVLYPVDEFKRRIEKLRVAERTDESAYYPKTNGYQIHWLDLAISNLGDADFAGIISEHEYNAYHDWQIEINVVSE